MHIIMITDGTRTELAAQTVVSMHKNAASWSSHRLRLVFDGDIEQLKKWLPDFQRCANSALAALGVEALLWEPTTDLPDTKLGVGGAKNHGASRLNLRSTDLLMFSDDDMCYLPRWDSRLETAIQGFLRPIPVTQLGGWRHPFHALGGRVASYQEPIESQELRAYEVDAVTGNCFVIRWSDWLKYGPFDSNAIGPGQSEDYALSQRIRAGGGLVATLDPPVAVHCGLVNSVGEPATGWKECEEQITEQLAGLSAEIRNDVLIMRPGDIGMGATDPALERPAGSLGGIACDPTTNPHWHGEFPYKGYLLDKLNRAASRMFGDAEDPRDIIRPGGLGGIREITLDEAKEMFPLIVNGNPKRLRRLHAVNIGSGQRRFESVPAVYWQNVDLVSRPPDQVPDIVGDARNLDTLFVPNSQDYVVSHHLHEHLGHGEADPITKAAYQVLRVGGSLLVFTPDARKLAGRWLGGELDDFQFAVQMMGAYQGEESDRHKWIYTQETLERSLADAAPWREVKPFDWRAIPGADLARDWYIAAVECVK